MSEYLPCICGEYACLEFDGGFFFKCYDCDLECRKVFSARAARKEFKALVARLKRDD